MSFRSCEYLPKDMPPGWQIVPLKRVFEVRLGKMLQRDELNDTDRLVPYLKANNVQWEGVDTRDLPEMWASPRDIREFEIRKGDLLVCEGGDAGRSAAVGEVPPLCIIQNALHRVRCTSSGEVRFLRYVMESVARSDWFGVLCNRATIAHLTGDKLGALLIPLPSLNEQRVISDFLDQETARIDTLIELKKRLLLALEENRRAIISRTIALGLPPEVARAAGLDPDQETKGSGVSWIHRMPAHWKTMRLRHISDGITVGVVVNPSSYVSDDGVPFLLGGDVREFTIETSNCKRCPAEVSDGPLAKSRLNAGDLVVVRVGYPGIAAVVPPALEGANCASMMIVRRHKRFFSQWLAYAFNAQVGRDQVQLVQYGAAQKQYNISHAVNFVFPFPPIEEQHAIADYLDKESARLGNFVRLIEAAMLRLQEYRSALISVAVTGQIDVRNYRPQEAAAACL